MRKLILVVACGISPLALASPSYSVEGAAGFYLLGSKGSMAGYVPPPGTYVQHDNYFYSGEAGANVQLPLGANLAAGVEADAYYGISTVIYVTPEKIAGGNLGLAASVVTGWKDITATAVVGPFTASLNDDETNFGDPVLQAMLGWHSAKWHSNIYTMINVPVGQYDEGELANIGFNRWAIDTGAAVTYLDSTLGHEVSASMGFTYNFQNPDTDYKSGTEFHVEAALVQHFSKQLTIGIVAYHYQQVSGDSGVGARLGDFEGRATGLGPIITYAFECGKIPVNTSLRYFKEFDVENRLEGDVGLFTVSMPLSTSGH